MDMMMQNEPSGVAPVEIGTIGSSSNVIPVGNEPGSSVMGDDASVAAVGGEPGEDGNGSANAPGTVPVPFLRKAINKSKEFHPINIKRSFMMCKGRRR